MNFKHTNYNDHTVNIHVHTLFTFYTHSRHLDMKSTNSVSLQRIAVARSLDPGFLFLPLLLVIHLGLPLESEKE